MTNNLIYNSIKKHCTFYIVHSKLNKGFTLIEIIVVVAIIGILSSLLMANFLGARERARDATRKSDLSQIQSALEFYRSDNGFYPPSTELQTCGKNVTFSATPPGATTPTTYLDGIPCNPDPATGSLSPYKYSPNACVGAKCYEYTLTANLENKNDPQAVENTTTHKFEYILKNP